MELLDVIESFLFSADELLLPSTGVKPALVNDVGNCRFDDSPEDRAPYSATVYATIVLSCCIPKLSGVLDTGK